MIANLFEETLAPPGPDPEREIDRVVEALAKGDRAYVGSDVHARLAARGISMENVVTSPAMKKDKCLVVASPRVCHMCIHYPRGSGSFAQPCKLDQMLRTPMATCDIDSYAPRT